MLEKLNREYFDGRGVVATAQNKAEFRRVTGTWLELLMYNNKQYCFKNPFSGIWDTKYVYLKSGNWKKARRADVVGETGLYYYGFRPEHPRAEAWRFVLKSLGDLDSIRREWIEEGEDLYLDAFILGRIDALLEEGKISGQRAEFLRRTLSEGVLDMAEELRDFVKEA